MTGSEKKWFTGLPIPGGAAVLATTVIFYNDTFGNVAPDQNFVLLVMTYVTALLMISTVKFHSLKELNVRDRRPFWMLLVAVVILVAVALDPPVVLFGVTLFYVLWALIEFLLTFRHRRVKIRPNP
jgi:CDP-diacylglycerol--serine O-phosphatidyltransferase